MLGKVLWKMHDYTNSIHPKGGKLDFHPAIDAFVQAIECIPEKRDGRHSEKDPILEPHYKLVSITHKLVRSGKLAVSLGKDVDLLY